MTLDPLLSAAQDIRLHVAFALVALIFGPVAIFRRRRDRVHRVLGYAGVAGMAGLAATGLLIDSDFPLVGKYGPIHLLSLYALWSLAAGVLAARRRQFARHEAYMKSLWFTAIGITGLLTLLPGRVMNRMIFGEASEAGFMLMAQGAVGLALLWLWQRRPTRAARRL
jgi:uncharacterized membrane protein